MTAGVCLFVSKITGSYERILMKCSENMDNGTVNNLEMNGREGCVEAG